jgi:hypothetical protein
MACIVSKIEVSVCNHYTVKTADVNEERQLTSSNTSSGEKWREQKRECERGQEAQQSKGE